ncbi:MAG: hypothetical protein C4522_14330 [Desulfobacteraceae bacterium]|nr:MAG: hypothetical protein C4522_14330 [Desulfobacteraceae bacterium]
MEKMTHKVFILNNKATFICPKCDNVKTIDATPYAKTRSKVEVNCKCPCGHFFKAIMERRNYLRKDIMLPGIYCRFSNGEEIEKGQMVVMNLSRAGLKFKPRVQTAFQVGDRLHIVINLNDPEKTLIDKMATIMNINDESNVGMEFCEKESYGKIGALLFG